MIRNYNRSGGGSDVDLSPIYSQLNTINNWILHADFDTNLSQSLVNLSNDYTNFTNTIDTYLDNYMDDNLPERITNITNSITKNSYDINILNNATSSLETSFYSLSSLASNGFNQCYSQINSIKNYTSSMNESINSINLNTNNNYTAITLLSSVINDINTNTSSLFENQNNHNSSITNLSSSVQFLMDNIYTNVQPQLFRTSYNETMFSESFVCFYNPFSATVMVNDLSYNSVVGPQQAISMNCMGISSANNVALNIFNLNLTCNHVGNATFNSANIYDVNIQGNRTNSNYLLDLEFKTCVIMNAKFNSMSHLNYSENTFLNLELNNINRCELINNLKEFNIINANNIWQFIMTNTKIQDNATQKTLNINNCSIVSLSSLGSISSVNINNCVYYTLNNNTISTCKIECTNYDPEISANTVVPFAKNSIQLLSAKNIANNFESNTINTAILEYPLYELHPPHKIIGNNINVFYFEYYDYSYLEMYMNKIYNNTISTLYLPVENNYYQTINNSTYDLSIFNSISNYFKSNNTINVILPWFK